MGDYEKLVSKIFDTFIMAFNVEIQQAKSVYFENNEIRKGFIQGMERALILVTEGKKRWEL